MIELGVLRGDGIGPEIVSATTQVVERALDAAAVGVRWVPLPFGRQAIDEFGTPVPDVTLERLDGLTGWIIGPHDNAGYPEQFRGTLSPGGVIRKRYNLFANIRPARALSTSVRAVCPDIDVVIVRENTEGFYADRNMYDGAGEFMPTADVALAVAVFTRAAIERIAHEAFRIAATRRRSVTIAHKTNVLTRTTGLFRDTCMAVADQYPDVEVRGEHVDALAALLVSRPTQFDVIVAENMFGDILSDLTGQLSGSLGMAPSLNASDSKAMAQASHGAAPDIAGRDVANPVAMMLSAAMLLRWLGERAGSGRALVGAADAVEHAVRRTLDAGLSTPDVGGSAGTREFTDGVLTALRPT